MVNPQWEDSIEVRRINFPRPRTELIELLGEERQWLPVFVLPNGEVIDEPIEITSYIAKHYGGAAPHP